MVKKEMSTGTKIALTAFLLLGLMLVGSFMAFFVALFGETELGEGNVALIPLEGVLFASGETNSYAGVASSDTVIADIAYAEADEDIKGVIFMINSPGGSAVASDEIARAILEMEKPSASVIREVGASGAYWAASATDHIVANRMSITGSIGVISSYLSFGDFLSDWNVTYNRLVAGNRKDVGSPFRELSADEEQYLQVKLDRIHGIFVAEVAANRNLSIETVEPHADGSFFLGLEALDYGLVDELGGEAEAVAWMAAQIGEEVTLVEYAHDPSFLDVLASIEMRSPLAFAESAVPLLR